MAPSGEGLLKVKAFWRQKVRVVLRLKISGMILSINFNPIKIIFISIELSLNFNRLKKKSNQFKNHENLKTKNNLIENISIN